MDDSQWTCPDPVGILEIDQQHTELHKLLLRLIGTIAVDPNGSLAEFRYRQLVDRTEAHFLAEDECFQRLGYPERDAHRSDHLRIQGKVREDLGLLDHPDTPPLGDLVAHFAGFVQLHQDTQDRSFALWREQRSSRNCGYLPEGSGQPGGGSGRPRKP